MHDFIDFTTVLEIDDKNQKFSVTNIIDDTIIPNTNTVSSIVPLDLYNTIWVRVFD